MDDVSAARSFALPLVIAALIFCSTSAASSQGLVPLAPVQDVSLPFRCEWGYEPDERCYRDDGDRMPVGGDDDKVWRAALRFSTPPLPRGAVVEQGVPARVPRRTLPGVWRKTHGPCPAVPFELAAHPILSASWFSERELDFEPAIAGAELEDESHPQWLSFGLTELVADWVAGTRRNEGVLLKLADAEEDFGVSDPTLPSSTFSHAAVRPRLEVTYLSSGP